MRTVWHGTGVFWCSEVHLTRLGYKVFMICEWRELTGNAYPTCCPLVRFSHIGSIEDAARDGPCAHGKGNARPRFFEKQVRRAREAMTVGCKPTRRERSEGVRIK